MIKSVPFIVILLVLMVNGCKSTDNLVTTDGMVSRAQMEPQVIFLNYLLRGNSNSELTKAELVNHVTTPGQLKRDRNRVKATTEKGDLILIFTDPDGKTIKELIFNNPLLRDIEYPSDNGSMAHKKEALEEVQFSIRTQLPEGAYFILIKKSTPSKRAQSKLLLKSKIETT